MVNGREFFLFEAGRSGLQRSEKAMRGKSFAASIALCTMLLWPSALSAQTGIELTSAERTEIWRSLGKMAMDTSVPAGLYVGEKAPDTMRLLAFSRHLRNKVPAIRSYAYALSHGQVLIVERHGRKIVSIVSE